ncbi:MATE family efflux transporter [Candidatus Comchoanobacter bicostacola]|uniref:MATE family efflux transporter n=1 Tax=Candidatus Comchoanobacter bicostacola TaxID=2919598 RepID=A0ABY5DLP6_9GAMM|nr:MATE family efflux transporter [Candidatus Comchoanobacter bicostacola]UTC24682.1 MATE family efflux transporter [Candidatus Comchoanobacter bicostacola]
MADVFSQSPQAILKQMFLPMALGFMMLMLIDFTDVVIAQMISDHALAILSYCFPIIYFILAAGIGLNQGLTIVGSRVYVSDKDELWSYVWHTVCLAMLLTFALVLLVSLGLSMQWVDPNFIPYMNEISSFIYRIMFAIFPMFLLLILCALVQIQCRTHIIRDTLVIMLGATLLLHPLIALPLSTESLLNGIQPLLDLEFLNGSGKLIGLGLGLNGIAISKCIVTAVGIIFAAKNGLSGVAINDFKLSRSKFYRLGKNVFPAISIQLLIPIYLYALNLFVADYGILATAGFGLGYRIAMLIVVPVLAVLIALMVLISHYHEEKAYAALKTVLDMAIKKGCGIIFFILFITALVSSYLMSWFGITPEIAQVASSYLWLTVILTIFEYIVGVVVVLYQAMLQPAKALLMALTKTIIFPIPALFIANYFGSSIISIWFALLSAFSISGIIALYRLRQENKKWAAA